MMALGPNFPISTNFPPLAGEGGGDAPADGDPFALLLGGLGEKPPGDGEEPDPAGLVKAGETIPPDKKLTMKTFGKLLDGNPVPKAPSQALETEGPGREQDGGEQVEPEVAVVPRPAMPDAALVPPMIAELIKVAESPVAESPVAEAPESSGEAPAAIIADVAVTPRFGLDRAIAAPRMLPADAPMVTMRPAVTAEDLPEADGAAGDSPVEQAPKSAAMPSPAAPSKAIAEPVLAHIAPLLRPNAQRAGGADAGPPVRIAEISAQSIDVAPAIQPAAPGAALPVFSPLQAVSAMPAQPLGSTPAPPAADQAIEQQLDLAHEGEWLDQLSRDIARSAGRDGALRFRLNPEHLGHLQVELSHNQSGTSLRISAETEAARAIIADAQHRLVAEARAQGVRIAESHVDLGGHGPGSGDPRRGDAQRDEILTNAPAGTAGESSTDAAPRRAAERYA